MGGTGSTGEDSTGDGGTGENGAGGGDEVPAVRWSPRVPGRAGALVDPSVARTYSRMLVVARPLLAALSVSRWSGLENLPERGALVVVSNHVSLADPVTLARFLLDAGRPPSFLAKDSLFTVPVIGSLLSASGQVPVHRGAADAGAALVAARTTLARGGCVVVYTDGTLTKDPLQWPMVGKSGAVRLALDTGAPVVPVAQWGVQRLLPRGGLPRLLPRAHLRAVVGEPVDLDRWRAAAPGSDHLGADGLREATDHVVDALVSLLEGLRGETAPARWDPRTSSRLGDTR